MPASDVTIIPSYERKSSSVNVQDNPHTKVLTIQVEDARAVLYEDEVRFTLVPEKGYRVQKIDIIDEEDNLIDYSETSNENEYKFTMPDTDVTITPYYEKINIVLLFRL